MASRIAEACPPLVQCYARTNMHAYLANSVIHASGKPEKGLFFQLHIISLFSCDIDCDRIQVTCGAVGCWDFLYRESHSPWIRPSQILDAIDLLLPLRAKQAQRSVCEVSDVMERGNLGGVEALPYVHAEML